MKNKRPKTSNDVLLMLLRKKQSKNGVPYITTKSTSYRIVRWVFFAMVIICTLINLAYILGKSGELAANLANMGEIQPHQQVQIDRINVTLIIMGIATVGLVLSEVFIWLKLPLLQLIFSFASSITIVSRLWNEIEDPTSYVLSRNHIIPLTILCTFAAISSIFYMRQLYKDKKGCQEISEIIYAKYNAVAKDISPEEWENVIAEYEPEVPKSKKRSVKQRRRLKKEKEPAEKNEAENPEE